MQELFDLPDRWYMICQTERPYRAVEFLMEHLAKERGTHYQHVDKPDERERNRPAADFLYRDGSSGRLIAVEYKEYTNPKVAEATTVVSEGKTLRRRGPTEVTPIEMRGETVGFREPTREYPRDLSLLDKFVAAKIKKGQLANTQAEERMMLIYDRTVTISERAFHGYRCTLTADDKGQVDRAFLVVEQRRVFPLW